MLSLRILSALIGIPLLLAIIYVGEYVLAGSLLILIIIGTFEFKAFLRKNNSQTMLLPIIIGEIIFMIGALNHWSYWFSLGLAISFILILTLSVVNYPKYNLMDISGNFFILIYVGWSLTHLLLLRNLSQGFLLVMFLFLTIWASDTGAYFVGRFLGKNKLAEKVSPNKTIEGAIGGLVFSIFTAIIFNYYVELFSLPSIIFLAIFLSIIGQLGDLIESVLKRLVKVKDSGNLIPGHGGVLDRFDSIITTAPLFYYLMLLIDKVG